MQIPKNILDTCLRKVVKSHLLLPLKFKRNSMYADHTARDTFLSDFIRQLLSLDTLDAISS